MKQVEKVNDQEQGLKQKRRLLALDAARGLAVIGMYIQHFALNERNANIVSGNTMILFFLCSGISYSIMSQSAANKSLSEKGFRTKVLARSVFIDLLGYVLLLLNGPFAVVLTAYAMVFMMALLLRNCTDKTLAIVSASSFLLSPIIMIVGMSYLSGAAMLQDIAAGPLSGIAVLPVFTAGMLIGRKDLRDKNRAVVYILAGIGLVIFIKLLDAFVLPDLAANVENLMVKYQNYSEVNEYAPWPLNVYPVSWHLICTAGPQSGSIFSLLLGMGVSMIVLGAAVLLEKKAPMLLKPFSAVGQVALTMYVLQIVIGWLLSLFEIELGIGNLMFGDIGVLAVTTIAGVLLSKLRFVSVEGMLRRFEKLFI